MKRSYKTLLTPSAMVLYVNTIDIRVGNQGEQQRPGSFSKAIGQILTQMKMVDSPIIQKGIFIIITKYFLAKVRRNIFSVDNF